MEAATPPKLCWWVHSDTTTVALLGGCILVVPTGAIDALTVHLLCCTASDRISESCLGVLMTRYRHSLSQRRLARCYLMKVPNQ